MFSRVSMHWKLLLAPLLRSRSRARLAAAALMLAAALVTVLGTLNRGVAGGVSREFRRYGANLVGVPRDGGLLPTGTDSRGAVGVQYAVATVGDVRVVIAGADLERLRVLNGAWEVTGGVPHGGECWLGVNAARQLHVGVGGEVRLALDGHMAAWRVAGTVASGGSEDDQVLAPYAQVAVLSGRDGYTTLELHVEGGAAAMAAAVSRLSVTVPAARWQPVLQVAAGETRILASTRAMVPATSGLILLTVLLCVTAALTTLAVARRRDFALMRALGAGEAAVAGGFAGEAALLGIVAAVPGIVLGGVVAGVMGDALFGVWLWPAPAAVAAAVVLSAAVGVTAALLPWPVLHAATPAALLRGE